MGVHNNLCAWVKHYPIILNITRNPAWAVTWGIICIYLYGSSYIDPLKFGTWVLTHEWMLAWDATVQLMNVLLCKLFLLLLILRVFAIPSLFQFLVVFYLCWSAHYCRLPQDYLFGEQPQLARWDEEAKVWRTGGFEDVFFDLGRWIQCIYLSMLSLLPDTEDKTVMFKTFHFSPLAIIVVN